MIEVEALTDQQREAVNRALDMTRRCAAIAGAAGTGKTTIMQIVYDALKTQGYSPVIVAPTGKAAKRVREATGVHAKTIHMLLEYTAPYDIDERTGKPYGATYPRRDRSNPIDFDHVLADEYAMVNRELHANLVQALPAGGRLIVFGDDSQLPPIEESAKLQAEPSAFITLFNKFNGITLEKIHRQSEDSGIIFNASRIRSGMAPQKRDDFNIIYTEKHIAPLLESCSEVDYTTLDNQIITPTNSSFIGTTALNAVLQANIARSNPTHILPRHQWHAKNPLSIAVGDKVIMTKNWYDIVCHDYDGNETAKGMFNGEVGIVTEITDIDEVMVDTGDRICTIPPIVQTMYQNKIVTGIPQKDLQLAYAITTHKAQGSEYTHVVYLMSRSQFMLLNRRNLYTGITRAKKTVTLITDTRALTTSIATKEPRVFNKSTTLTKDGK